MSRASINHWNTPLSDPLRVLLAQRYAIAGKYVEGRVGDYACAYGVGASILAKLPDVDYVVGMDIDKDAVAFGAGRVPSNVALHMGDIETHPILDLDWIVCTETLEHLIDPIAFIRKCKKAAREGLVVSVPIRPTVGTGNPTHRHDFTLEILKDLCGEWKPVHTQILQEEVAGEMADMYSVQVWRRPTTP